MTIAQYEAISDLDAQKGKTEPFKKSLAKILSYLADKNYASAEADLKVLSGDTQKEKERRTGLPRSS
jgi:hypothetical protein